MTADQLKEALTHFSTSRAGLDPFDHVIVMGEPMRQFPVDVQQTCATALTYIFDLELIALAYKEEKPYGPSFMAMLQERRDLEMEIRRLKVSVERQAGMIHEMSDRLAAAGGG